MYSSDRFLTYFDSNILSCHQTHFNHTFFVSVVKRSCSVVVKPPVVFNDELNEVP